MKEEKIKKLLEFMEEHNLQELEVKGLFYHIKLKKWTGQGENNTTVVTHDNGNKYTKSTTVIAQPSSEEIKAEEKDYHKIVSPMVGTFYRSPSPGAEPFVKEGDLVKKGQVVCIIEAMKVMNEIESDVTGRIVKVLVENGKPVEYNQPLFLVDTEDN
ncbi:MAG: acetyl-CoA carboxylase biotin carboxyl carrier protein [candidate division WOR-3 bacterium]